MNRSKQQQPPSHGNGAAPAPDGVASSESNNSRLQGLGAAAVLAFRRDLNAHQRSACARPTAPAAPTDAPAPHPRLSSARLARRGGTPRGSGGRATSCDDRGRYAHPGGRPEKHTQTKKKTTPTQINH